MKNLFVTFIILAILLALSPTISGQEEEPTGDSNTTTGIYCPNDCSNRAPACDEEWRNTCWCLYGFYGDDCSETVATDIPVAWYTIRVIFVLLYGGCTVIGILAIVYGPHQIEQEASSADQLTFFFNVRKGVLITLVALCFVSVLYYALDPQGFEFILPFVVVQLLFGFVFPLLSILYTLVVFHWAEIYYTTVKVLRREEMLEKINSRYESNITLNMILTNIKFLNKLKIPFLVLNIVAVITQLIRDLWYGITVDPMNAFSNVWLVVMFLLYLIEGVGFLFYGRKLYGVLPEVLQKKMRRVTITILVTTVLFLLSYIYAGLAFIFLVKDSWTFILADGVWRLVMLFIVFAVLSLFVKVSRVPPFLSFGQSSKGGSSNPEDGISEFETVAVSADITEDADA